MATKRNLIITGDINLMGTKDPGVPFSQIGPVLRRADGVLANLECCLYDPADGRHAQEAPEGLLPRAGQREGFYASTDCVRALKDIGVTAVGNANNANWGDEAIASSLKVLKDAGIPSTGAGLTRSAAMKPAIVDVKGLSVGMIQRTCVYWPNNHEASKTRPGVAALKAHTAYSPRVEAFAASRPGMEPTIHTWVEPVYMDEFIKQVKALKKKCDFPVVSIHWGYKKEVLGYMKDLAHAAVDAGASLVFGHGPHDVLACEVHKGVPIYYGLGSLSFDHAHRGRRHGDWLGAVGRLTITGKKVTRAAFSFVRHNNKNETIPTDVSSETEELERLREQSKAFDTELKVRGNQVVFFERR